MSNPYGGEVQEGVYKWMQDHAADILEAIKEGVKEAAQEM